ncbi:MAG: rhodanese-like domain-containing protein [Proteobacteria bacterium]|nr:rhodanese-like domain-containing protein [Pseudomonadota bacterium]
MKLSKDSQLATLKIPHLATVIEEAFAVLRWPSEAQREDFHQWTIGRLADQARLPIDGVLARLEKIESMAEHIEISPKDLHSLIQKEPEKFFLLDVREPWEFEICRIPGSQLMAQTDLARIFGGLKELTVIAICHHGVRSLSAAFYLREAGLPSVKSLTGGVEAWALELDQKMPRY